MSADLVARTVRGLEGVAAWEVTSLDEAMGVRAEPRQVSFAASCQPGPLQAAMSLRTVDDVFARVGVVEGPGRAPSSVGPAAARIAALDIGAAADVVRSLRPVPDRPIIDVVVSLDGDRRFSRYDLEDAVGSLLAPVLAGDHASRREGRPPPADLSVRIDVAGDRAEVLVRLADRPLHRRTWKVATGPATLHPPLAAALVRLDGDTGTVIDPCCGDGTIVVEAALGATSSLAIGIDIDARRMTNASANARAAGVTVPLVQADATTPPLRVLGPTSVVTNPPWAVNVRPAGGLDPALEALWRSAADMAGTDGRLVTVTDAGADAPAALEGAGWSIALALRLRLAGRLCDLVVASAGDLTLPPGLREALASAPGL